MYVLKLNCVQGEAYAWRDAGCTDKAIARRFDGPVDAIKWLFDHQPYLIAIGSQTFELVKV